MSGARRKDSEIPAGKVRSSPVAAQRYRFERRSGALTLTIARRVSGGRWDFEARKVAQWVEHLIWDQTVEGSTPSFSTMDKALNRLAVRIRSLLPYPGSHPGGR